MEAYDSATQQQVLYALDFRDHFASAQSIVVVPDKSTDAQQWAMSHRNRLALLLSNGVVYLAFGSFICDHPLPYDGWVFGYDAKKLTQVSRWQTPGQVGIWQSGRGLVASNNGDIYLMTGSDAGAANLDDPPAKDGNFANGNLANSFVKLRPSVQDGPTRAGALGLRNSSILSLGNTDLGSSGPLLLPGDRLIGGGKQDRVYVLDAQAIQILQDPMKADGFEGFQAFVNNFSWSKEFMGNVRLWQFAKCMIQGGF